jgi:hypothetical protein
VALPEAIESGCVLGVPRASDVRSADATLEATVTCTSEQPIQLVAALRGREIGRASGSAGPAASTLRVPLTAVGQGAVRLTLFATNAPAAERLVYRKLGADVSITLTPEQATYAPRETVSLLVETRGPDGRPISADLAVAVVDDAVLSLADDRAARIRARLYLEAEMPGQEVDDPSFYFSADPKAPAALDLVLGTQGWRRFKRVAAD